MMARARSRSRRVLIYVLNSGNLYGTERMALATLAGFADYDERVVFAPPATSSTSVLDAARAQGYGTAEFLTRTEFARALLPWLLRYWHVDMIGTGVGQSYIAYVLSIFLCVRMKQLQVAHGGTEAAHAYGRKRPLNRIPVQLIAVSDYVRDRLVEHGVRRDRISVIENFMLEGAGPVPTRPPFDPQQPGAQPLDRRRTRVAVVSRIDPIKRIELLLEAAARPGLEDFSFDIYGTGSELERLRARAADLPHVRFHGFESNIPARLAEADFLLHLCPEEPFGLVVLEGFRAGVVVIVPAAGGAGSIVDDELSGLKFRPDDVDDLRRVLRRARELGAEELDRFVASGRRVLERRFSPAVGQRRYREVLSV